MTLGEKIKLFRVAKKLTQFELAQKIGISQPKLSYIERGRIPPQETELNKIKEILGFRLD